MVRTAVIVALAISIGVPVQANEMFDAVPPQWLIPRSPFGFDITKDSRIWINLNPVGEKDDFGMLALDIIDGTTTTDASVWVRGYHRKNTKVNYRTSMTKYYFKCKTPTYYTGHSSNYDAEGTRLYSSEAISPRSTIVPGTVAEYWQKVACDTQEKNVAKEK